MKRLLAIYSTKEKLSNAAKALGERADVYSSFDIETLSSIESREPIDFAPFGFIGAVLGGASGYFMEYYLSVKDLPLNIGGRPVHTAIAFIPITFECAVLGAGLFIVAAFFWSMKLPELYHPLFDSPNFRLSIETPFFIVVDESLKDSLVATHPQHIERIEA